MADALYEPDGDLLVPTTLTAGPWSADAQHGGPVAALLASAVEHQPAPVDMVALRITVELLRPVPLRPLRLDSAVTRPGRKVQLVEASLSCAGEEVARARGLRLRRAPVAVPAPSPAGAPPAVPPPLATVPGHLGPNGYFQAVDLRFVAGSWEREGPATVWGRLTVPVVAGQDLTPLAAVAAVADFGNGISRLVPFETHRFLNADLTVACNRPLTGAWVGLDVVTRLSPDGFGQAESAVFDVDGPCGRAVQTLLVEPRA